VLEFARAVDESGLDTVWINERLAWSPPLPEVTTGRTLDPLATLAFLAAVTRRVGLGTAVLNLPFRPALPTAEWVATLQDLSGGRVRLGVGAGWMEAEFGALGLDLKRARDPDRRDARCPPSLLRERRGRAQWTIDPLPTATGAAADLCRRLAAACSPACGAIRRGLDSDRHGPRSPRTRDRATTGALRRCRKAASRGDRNEDATARGSATGGGVRAAVSGCRGHPPRSHASV